MKTRAELLRAWAEAVSKMHIGHHLAAAYFTKWHYGLGAGATAAAAVVGATVFATLTKLATDAGFWQFLAVALLSTLSPALTAAVTFLKLDERSLRHTRAAASFAGLRRAMELAEIELAEGKKSDNLIALQSQWRDVIRESPPLPQFAYDRAVKQIQLE